MFMQFVKRSFVQRAGRILVAAALGGLATLGCTSSSESAKRDTMTAHVGNYTPPPAGARTPRVGVPPFSVQAAAGSFGGSDGSELNALAADQMTSLLDASGRFRVIERAQLQKLLDEQNLEGIVKAGEMAKSAQVRGVDYLLLGRVTNLRVKREDKKSGLGVAQVGGLVNLGGFDYKKKDIRVTTEAGVDIRLVDPSSGEVVVSNFSEFQRSDAANAIGIAILGASAESDADIQISNDDKGKILRMALDDALRKSLPRIDRFLATSASAKPEASAHEHVAPAAVTPQAASSELTTPVAPSAPAAPATPPAPATPAAATPAAATPAAATPDAPAGTVVGKKFCGECGKEIPASAKFCPFCGAKIN